jgi:hypothetical protein
MTSFSTIGVLKLGPPTLSTVAYGKFPMIGTWMFVIDDGHPDGPLVSGANGKNELYVGRLANPLDATSWAAWVPSSLLLATDAKDSWHVYAHGLHWISYSKPLNTDLNLFVLDRDLTVLLGGAIEVVKEGGGLYPKPDGVVTNDHFLATLRGTTASPGPKVSIAISAPAPGVPPSTTILVVSKAGLLESSSTLAPAICNGSSGELEFH